MNRIDWEKRTVRHMIELWCRKNHDGKACREMGSMGGGLVSQGLGTSMLQMPNIVKNPRIWIAPTLTSAITGPIATCLFKLQMNGAAINSGMGTCGLCGQLGVWTGWVSPSEQAIANGAAAIAPTAFDWAGLILISFVLPAILAPAINQVCRKLGWVKDGDVTLA